LLNRRLYGFGAFVLDPEQAILRDHDGQMIALPPKVVATLLVLVERRGEVVSKQVLMDAVWPESFVEEGNLTQNIFLLRRELGKTSDGEDYIQTLSKRGYRLTVPVVDLQRPEFTHEASRVQAWNLPLDQGHSGNRCCCSNPSRPMDLEIGSRPADGGRLCSDHS